MSKENRMRHVWIIVLITVLGCLPTEVLLAQTDDQSLTPQEMALAAEIRNIIDIYGSEVWSGWEKSASPLLLRKGDYDYLIGHPEPPPSFEEMPGLTLDNEPVLRMQGHLIPVPVATSWQVDEVWVAATPVRDEFQQAIDEVLGEGVIVLDDVSYVRAVTHEAFHAFHMSLYDSLEDLPPFADMSGDLSWYKSLSESERADLDGALLEEARVLNKALAENATDENIKANIAEFLRLRDERRAELPDSVAEFEQGVEWLEGAARYADTQLLMMVGSSDYELSAEANAVDLVYPLGEEVWDDFREQVDDILSLPGGYRDRLYVLGAAQMFVLDRLVPDWQSRMFGEGLPPETLLLELLEQDPQ
jgi:hypothetical protein